MKASKKAPAPQTWAKPVRVEPPSPTSSNGVEIEYRGLWQVFDDQVYTAKLRQTEAEQSAQAIAHERDLLRFENDELRIKFKENLASLTETSSNHLEAQQILAQIRSEREKLISRIAALESHQDWLENQNKKMRENIQNWQTKLEGAENEVKKLNANLVNSQKQYESLEAANKSKDEKIAQLGQELQPLQREHSVLQRSLTTKDRLYHHALKERDELKEEVQELKRQLQLPRSRTAPSNEIPSHIVKTPTATTRKTAHKSQPSTKEVGVSAFTAHPCVDDLLPLPPTPVSTFVPPTPCPATAVPDFLTGDDMPGGIVYGGTLMGTTETPPPTRLLAEGAEGSNPWARLSSPMTPRALLQSPPTPVSTRSVSRMGLRRHREKNQHQEGKQQAAGVLQPTHSSHLQRRCITPSR